MLEATCTVKLTVQLCGPRSVSVVPEVTSDIVVLTDKGNQTDIGNDDASRCVSIVRFLAKCGKVICKLNVEHFFASILI